MTGFRLSRSFNSEIEYLLILTRLPACSLATVSSVAMSLLVSSKKTGTAGPMADSMMPSMTISSVDMSGLISASKTGDGGKEFRWASVADSFVMDSIIGTVDSMLSTAMGAVAAEGVGPEANDVSTAVLVDWV